MALTYKFYCIQCQYEAAIYIGSTKREFYKGLPQSILGSCSDCSKLFSNTKRNCKFCNKAESSFPNINTFERIKNWLFNKITPSLTVKFYNEESIKKVPCPKCNCKYLMPHPILFSD